MKERWQIKEPKKCICWKVKPGEPAHEEDYEMAGFLMSHPVRYGINEDGSLILAYHPVFPTLRLRPNTTHASFQHEVYPKFVQRLYVNGHKAVEKPYEFLIDGTLRVFSNVEGEEGVKIFRHCYPSTDKNIGFDKITVVNDSEKPVKFEVRGKEHSTVQTEQGCMGVNVIEINTSFLGTKTLKAHTSMTFALTLTGHLASEEIPTEDMWTALEDRYKNVDRLTTFMNIDTGDDVLDTLFTFALLRSGESVFRTKAGLLHSPGGYSYYAAVWCNDEVEYAGPHFAYTGDCELIDASMNAYKLYMPFMSELYEPIPSSIIAEGVDYWNGAGDRGDAAMYLYGASRFALTVADRDEAKKLWKAIKWCAEYCERKKNADGVIESDADELEGRFSAGKANLCTSTLCYSGLKTAAELAEEFDEPDTAKVYRKRADALRIAIEKYFGKNVRGFETYQYHENNELLRSWICMPLCVGILDRAQGTVDALLSDKLMSEDGLLSQEGCSTIWDRSTLYALRGIFAAGYTEKATKFLLEYSHSRLLGPRVPYPVEAFPEGNHRHLSGESALYCKIFTEGILAIEPEGFNRFSLKPTLPEGLDHFNLRKIHAFGAIFDIEMNKDGFRVVRSNGDVLAQSEYGQRVTVCTR